jgi:hypothetical protein
MTLLDLGTAPAIDATSHRDYLPWLAHRCFDRACAYCLEHARVLEVDHVEPVSLNPDRAKDPTNLLPACGTCNGATGKWDYHPQKLRRKKCPRDDHGFTALDPRRDDLAVLYGVEDDGELVVRPGEAHERALWNRDVLFRLNRPKLKKWRQQTLELVKGAEHLTEAVAAMGSVVDPGVIGQRDLFVRLVADRLLFIELLEIPLTVDLRALTCAVRDLERGPAPT